jgi:hypothetical protein
MYQNDRFFLPLIEDGDGMAIDDQLAVLHLHVSLVLAVGGVVLEHVHHVV